MTRKKLKPWEEFARERRDRERFAPKLSELHWEVPELRIELRFTPHDDPRTPIDAVEVWKPDQKAFFEIRCRDRECICGGFDLTAAIAETVKKRQTSAEGRLTCEGWQDTERYRRYGCLMQLDYRVLPSYRTT